MKKLYLVTAIVAAFLGGCSSDEPSVLTDTKQPTKSHNPYHVGLKDALKNVGPVMDVLDGPTKTRSDFRTVDDVEYIVNSKTRNQSDASDIPDTLFYVVNYSDEQGFAILSADLRIPSIVAISNTGNLNLSDTDDNKIITCWLDNITEQANTAALSNSFPGIFNPADSVLRPLQPSDRVIEITEHIKPHLDVYTSRWGQEGDFNSFSYSENGKRWPLGCGPLAISQIMSFHKWPNSLGDVSIDWNEVRKLYNEINLANPNFDKLYKFLAKVQSISGATPGEFPNMLLSESSLIKNITRLGYQSIGQPVKFGSSNMSSKLKNEPLLMASSIEDKSVGHMWVMDGKLSYKETWDALYDGVRYFSIYHCVWGWNGSNNGYFMFRIGIDHDFIDTTKPYDYEDGVDLGPSGLDKYKYSNKMYDLRYWTLTPKK